MKDMESSKKGFIKGISIRIRAACRTMITNRIKIKVIRRALTKERDLFFNDMA